MTECDPATAVSLLLIFRVLLHANAGRVGTRCQIAPKVTRLASFEVG